MGRATPVISAKLICDATYEAFQLAGGGALITQLNSRELAVVHINLAQVGVVDKLEWTIWAGSRMVAGGDWDAVTDASNLALETAIHQMSSDDEFVGISVVPTNGGEEGEWRFITSSAASGDTIVVDHAFSAAPAAGELYDLYRFSSWQSGEIIPLATGTHDNPQTTITSVMGPEFFVVLCRASGGTDAQEAYITIHQDGVSA